MVYNIQSLVSVKFLGDSKLEQFISNWDTVLCGMSKEPDDETKEQFFYEQVRHSKALQEDLAHYERVDVGHRTAPTTSSTKP